MDKLTYGPAIIKQGAALTDLPHLTPGFRLQPLTPPTFSDPAQAVGRKHKSDG